MIYAVFKANIKNPGALATYRDAAGEALAKYGGKVEQATPTPSALDGSPRLTDIAAVLSFPDASSAKGWINDPEFSHLHDLRRSAGETEILLLG